MKLSTSLLLLILVCLVPILGVEFYAQYSLHRARSSELDSLALHQAELVNGDLASIIEGLRQVATVAAQFPDVAAAAPGCGPRLAEVQRASPPIGFLAALDAEGRLLCASSAALDAGRGQAPAWLPGALPDGTVSIGRYSVAPGGEAFLPVEVAVSPAAGKVARIIAALDLAWLDRHLSADRIHPGRMLSGGELYITDTEGVVLSRWPAAPDTIGRRLPADLLTVALSEQAGSHRIHQGAEGTRVVATVPANIRPKGLVAIESLPLGGQLPQILRTGWRETTVTLAAALLALVLAWYTGRRLIARPTRTLLAAALRWRDGDLTARAAVEGGSELAALAQSFNGMAANLEARELERRLHAELLEARVEERTRALSDSNNRLQVEIAERERTEAALNQAQKLQAVGQLAGGIAHDFNNMLATVLGSLELMERRVGQGVERWTETDGARMRTLIERASGAVQRGAQLTSQLLAFSRRQRLSARATDLNQLITDLMTLATGTLGRRIRVVTELADGLWLAMVDPSQMEAAILNCCLNARDAMPEGGQITIATANQLVEPDGGPEDPAPGLYVRVSITDTGPGMPPEVLRHAFDPFFTTKGPRGSGLGLSQVYGMARQSGGAVRITSAVGEGTTVTLLLPQAEMEAEPGLAGGGGEFAASLPPTLVLVVDDDTAVRQVTVEMLTHLGCAIIQASGGAEALALLDAAPQSPDVVLLDYAMPGMNGVQVARALRVRGIGAPIALVTGYAELADRETDGSLLDALLRKPFTIRELSTVLMRLRRATPQSKPEAARVHGAA